MASRDHDAHCDLDKAKGNCQTEEGAGDGEEGQLRQDLDQGISKGNLLMEIFRFCHIQSQVFPNCPYTANNLSVHYWYWTSKDHNKESNKDRDGKLGGWRVDQLEELRRVGSKVEAMLEEGEGGGGARSMGHAKLLHSVWLKLHPESQETEESLAEVNFIISKCLCIDACQVLAAAREPQVQTNSRPGRKRTVLPLASQQVEVSLSFSTVAFANFHALR